MEFLAFDPAVHDAASSAQVPAPVSQILASHLPTSVSAPSLVQTIATEEPKSTLASIVLQVVFQAPLKCNIYLPGGDAEGVQGVSG